MNFIEELDWRGLLHQKIDGIEDFLSKGMATGYVGFDPTAPSLTLGNLVPVMMLVHFQRHGHKPIALVGGATGMVGDPSGKSKERNLLDLEVLQTNVNRQSDQLSRFLNFEEGDNKAEMVNNYDWFKEFGFLEFIRDVGKHITINYMMGKDSVKSRLDTGLSFTEFSYQLVQGYDYKHLYDNFNCRVQMGGSDQFGNITTGLELIRRMGGTEDAFAVTCPLLTKADGSKMGKSEGGKNIWLDGEMTTPYAFYQYFVNASDVDIVNYAKVFSLKSVDELKSLIEEHEASPGRRILQYMLGEELTARIHGEEGLAQAKETTEVMFSGGREALIGLREEDFVSATEGLGSKGEFPMEKLKAGIMILDFAVESGAFNSKREVREAIKAGSLQINRTPVSDEQHTLNEDEVLFGKYILVRKSKRKRHLVEVK